MISPVTASPTTPQRNSAKVEKVTPPAVIGPAPKITKVTISTATSENSAVAMKPRYSAPMIELFAGSFTK
jgi:hypothetical protein